MTTNTIYKSMKYFYYFSLSLLFANPFAFAEKFAEAGLTAITFDYRNFGFSGGRLRQYINVPMQMEDWHHVLAYARNRPMSMQIVL